MRSGTISKGFRIRVGLNQSLQILFGGVWIASKRQTLRQVHAPPRQEPQLSGLVKDLREKASGARLRRFSVPRSYFSNNGDKKVNLYYSCKTRKPVKSKVQGVWDPRCTTKAWANGMTQPLHQKHSAGALIIRIGFVCVCVCVL